MNQNVIVLDLASTTANSGTSTTTSSSNYVLSDILQMTGIISEDDNPAASDSNTTTLQKVPGDTSSWIVLDSNGSKDQMDNVKSETTKMDIFSQAMASAEIGDFSTATSANIEIESTDVERDSQPPLVQPPPKSNTKILFASPHDVMPTPASATKQQSNKNEDLIVTENNHGGPGSIFVDEIGDEIVSETEVVSMETATGEGFTS